MKIAHVTTVDLSLRYLLLNQLRCLQAAGYQVAAISAPGPAVPVLEAAGIRHFPVPLTRSLTPLADLAALCRLYRLMRRERFTLVHCHTPKAELLGQLAARLADVPVVVDTFRGIYDRPGMHPFWRWWFIHMARLAAACADLLLSQSRANLAMALREGICPPHKIEYLGNGIDLARFDPAAVDPAAVERLRCELALPMGAPVVGFVGRLVAEKGVLELLAAARTVLDHLPTARFLFVGPLDREKPDALHPGVARDYGLAGACTFAGMRQDMPELYALMDLFVLPSHRESFPRSPMEASAMGRPCVVTAVPGCCEAVQHGRNGLLVPLGDVEALAAAILRLLAGPGEARRLGREGRRLALERFDERFVFGRVEAAYARLLAEKGLSLPAPPVGLYAAAP